MDPYTFISNLIGSLAWPIVLLLLIFILRKEIRSLIPSLQKLRFRDFEMDFERKVEELEKHAQEADLQPPRNELLPKRTANESIKELIRISPRLAIVESFNWLEASIREAAIRHGIAKDEFFGVRNSFRGLVDKGIISERLLPLFNDLRVLCDDSSHMRHFEISPELARIYAEKAFSMANLISRA